MKYPLWLRAFKRSLSANRSPVRTAPTALRCEPLEDRAVPATLDTFLTTQHVDINLGYTGGAWTLQNQDSDNQMQYDTDVALLYAGDNGQSRQTRPAGAAFDFIGVPAGTEFFRLPQSQDPELLYLGFAAYGATGSQFDAYNPAAESKGRVSGNGRWLKVSLVDVDHFTPAGAPGDGQFSVWQSGDSGPTVLMSSYNDNTNNPNGSGLDTTDGIGTDDALWIVAGGHTHYNFGFTRTGRYEVQVKLSGYLDDGNTTSLGQYVESQPFKLYFSVGSVGELQFDSSTYTVNESAGAASVTVRRVGGSDGQIAVNYATSDGTATAGSDYTATSGTLTFLDGQTEKTITVPLTDDTAAEGAETVNLTLSNPGPSSIQSYLIDHEGDANGLLGTQSTAVLTILANDVPNDPPTISNVLDRATLEGTPTAAIPFTVGDTETPAADLVVTATSSNPALVPNANIVLGGSGASRTATITPAAGQSGTTTITLTVTDAAGATATDTFVLTVSPVYTLPGETIPDVVMNADQSVTINYTVPSASLVTAVSRTNTTLFNAPGTSSGSDLRTQPTSGGTARTLRIRPQDRGTSAGLYGTSAVTLSFTGAGAPPAQTFNVRVNPRAVADNNLLAIPGTTSTFDVLGNDVVPLAGHTFAITGVTGAANGTVVIDTVGGRPVVRYTPNAGYTGTDTFTYTVTVTSADEFNGYTFTGTGYVVVGNYIVVDSPTGAQHTDIDINFVNGEWVQNIQTDAQVAGVESGTFSPTRLDADEGLLFLDPTTKTARPANTLYNFDFIGAPVGADIWLGPATSSPHKLYLGIANEETDPLSVVPYLTGDPRAPGEAEWVTTQLVGFSGPGQFSAFDYGSTDGGVRVFFDTADGLNSAGDAGSGGNPTDTFFGFAGSHAHINWVFTQPGRYALTFQSTTKTADGFTTSMPTTFYFDVDSITGTGRLGEAPPQARPDAATAAEDSGPVTVAVLGNDTSLPDPVELLTVTGVTQGANGTVTIAADGRSVSYTPAANFNGTDAFTYTVTDEHGGTATATVTVSVAAVDDAPVAGADAYAVSVGNAVRGNVLFNDVDAEGDPLTAAVVTGPAHGTLALNPDGTFTYTPGAGFAGSDSFTYTVTAGGLTSAPATVTVTAAGFQDFGAVIGPGHADVGINYEDGAWDLHVHDHETDNEYEPDGAIYYVAPEALSTRPVGSEFDFVGVAAGQSCYRLPQTLDPELLYLGFGAEELEEGTFEGGSVRVSLVAVNGPGQFSVWESTDQGPRVLFATSDGITGADFVDVLEGGHTHYNWGFTAAGRYEVTIKASGTLVGADDPTSATATYYFSVDNLGRVQFDPAAYTVAEGGSTTLTVVRVGGSDGPLTVDYGASGGSAGGADYAPFAGTLTFADGETVKTFTVSATTDGVVEGNETVAVALTAPAGSSTQLGAPATATVAVTDVAPPSETPTAVYRAPQFIVLGSGTGRVQVLNAADRTLVREFAPFAGYGGVVAVAAGDVDGDGITDAIAAAGNSHVKVFSGSTGAELMSFVAFPGYAGAVTLAAGDVDGDGRADVVVGTATGSSHVKVFGGPTGSELMSFLAFDAFAGGVRVAAGDVSGDGRAEVVVVAGPGGNGHVKALDRSGALAVSFLGYTGYLGEINVATGDADGDRRADIVTVATNPANGVHMQAFSAAAGGYVRSEFVPQTAGSSSAGRTARVAVGDVTGDRVADILLGIAPGRLMIVSGAAVDSRQAFEDPLGLGLSLALN